MSNWEEIEKQVHKYATEYWASDRTTSRKEDEECAKEMADALANIKGIVEAMESQIPKECDHGVSMTEVCGQCKAELTIAGNQQQRCSFCGKDCSEHWIRTGVCGDCHIAIVGAQALKSEEPKNQPVECVHGISIRKECRRCIIFGPESDPQNEQIAQLSKRIDDCYDSLNRDVNHILDRLRELELFRAGIQRVLASTAQIEMNQRFLEFMAKCEENGKKREERIKSLEYRLGIQSTCLGRLDERLEVLEDWRKLIKIEDC